MFQKIKRDFNIGYNYAKLQAYLCVVISFSLICPIITAYGMVLLLIKYTGWFFKDTLRVLDDTNI